MSGNMMYIFICILLLRQINVLGQNIYFDCWQSIVSNVIQRDSSKIQEFLASGNNREILTPSVQGTATISTQLPKIDSYSYWRLTSGVNAVSFDFTRLGSSAYVITGIAIQTVVSTECNLETSINTSLFKFSYVVGGSEYEIVDITGSAINSDQSLPITFRTNIEPITAQNLTIQKSITGSEANCVRYEVFGCPIGYQSSPLLKVPILEYETSKVPLRYGDGGYTGICRDGKCMGGVGNLVDGYIGGISDLNRRESGIFTIWTEDVTVTLKLSNYINIGLVHISYAHIPTNSFNTSGQLITTSTQTINNLVNSIQLDLNTSVNMDIAVSEIQVFLGRNGENIQTYFQKLYQPQFCPNTDTSTSEKPVIPQDTILIVTVGVLAVLMLIMGITIIILVCGFIITQKSKLHAMDKLIDVKLHERTMTVAQNRLATYADVNDEEITTIRRKLREKMVVEQNLKPLTPKNSQDERKLIGNSVESDTQLSSVNETEHSTSMYTTMVSPSEHGNLYSETFN